MKYLYKRKKWFESLKKVLRIFVKKSQFVYLNEKIEDGSIIISNHEGSASPLALELYSEFYFRFWGTYEMNSGLRQVYKYLSETYYHKKKHWNLFLAKLFCLIAAPLVNLFYKGLDLISTYPDGRLINTIKESIQVLKDKKNLVIYPENSNNGYFKALQMFHPGIILFFEQCIKKNINAKVYITYLIKEKRKYIVAKPIYIKDLLDMNLSREELTTYLCDNCNSLREMNILN